MLDYSQMWDAADHLDANADLWEEAFTDIRDRIAGLDWEGDARDAEVVRANADLAKARTAAEAARATATVSRTSASDLVTVKRSVLHAVDFASEAGFGVDEDYTVTDRQAGGTAAQRVERQAWAQKFAADIRGRFIKLTGLQQEVAGKLTTTAAGIRNLNFDESPMPGIDTPSNDGNDGSVRTVGYDTFKDAPGGPLPADHKPWEYDLDLVSNASLPKDGLPSAGTIASINDVWNELHRCFNCNFPIGRAPKAFPKVGDELPLEMKVAGQQLANLPVKVTQIEKTADEINIEFTTLPGHADGPGSTIHFRFFEQGGELHLGIRGYITDGPGSDTDIRGPAERAGYSWIAEPTWQPYIDRLTTNIAKTKGFNVLALAPHRPHG